MDGIIRDTSYHTQNKLWKKQSNRIMTITYLFLSLNHHCYFLGTHKLHDFYNSTHVTVYLNLISVHLDIFIYICTQVFVKLCFVLNDFCTNTFLGRTKKHAQLLKNTKMLNILPAHRMPWVCLGERTYIRFHFFPTAISIKNKSTKTLFSFFKEVSHQMASNREREKASID